MVEDQENSLLPLADRPLVTFALFAYNQEKYIREAVEGAFAQSYEPLEIILSDDCSTDRTFEIMEKMAEKYNGPHKIITRKTFYNMRTFAHVIDVAKISKGKLIVLAAGDDISKKERVTELVKQWKMTGAWGLHSHYDIIDQNSNVIERDSYSKDLFDSKCELRQYFYEEDGQVDVIHGATSAYDRQAIYLIPETIPNDISSEDGVLTVFLNAYKKKCEFIEKSLVLYRQHSDAISNYKKDKKNISLAEARSLIKKSIEYSKNISSRAKFILEVLSNNNHDLRKLNIEKIKMFACFYGVIGKVSKYDKQCFFSALGFAIKERKIGLLVPVVFGLNIGTVYLFFGTRIKQIRNSKAI